MYNTINKVIRLATLFVVLVCIQFANHVLAQSATIHKIWIEHGVSYNGEKGMKVHAKVSVSGLKGKNIRMIAFFHDSSKEYLKGGISGYRATDGTPCVFEDTKPTYDNSSWEDYWLFMPYRALPLAAGKNTYYASFHVKDLSSGNYVNKGFVYESFTGTGSSNNGAQQPVAQYQNNQQQSLNYMDIHQKYSHSKYFNDWGSVVKSYKEEYTYFFVYNTGWIEGIKIEHCGVCHGQGGSQCPMCSGLGSRLEYDYYLGMSLRKPCSFCLATGRKTCVVCNGNPTYGRVEALHDEGDGYIRYYIGNMFNGTKGQMSYINTKSSGGGSPSGATIPIQSFQRYDNSSSGYDRGSKREPCPICNGSGKCSMCAGRGEYRNRYYNDELMDCGSCRGTGKCQTCYGTGKMR